MKFGLAIASLALAAAPAAFAHQPASYNTGVLESGSMECSTAHSAKGSKCQEFVLETDSAVYHLRLRDARHSALLPLGSSVQFRMVNDKLYVRNPAGDKREQEFSVVSSEPRAESAQAGSAQAVNADGNR
jgi:hypothetical protein